MQFTALEDFWCEETKSQYCKDMSYTVRPADAYQLDKRPPKEAGKIKASCEALARLFPQWIAEGKVRPGGPGGGQVRGEG